MNTMNAKCVLCSGTEYSELKVMVDEGVMFEQTVCSECRHAVEVCAQLFADGDSSGVSDALTMDLVKKMQKVFEQQLRAKGRAELEV